MSGAMGMMHEGYFVGRKDLINWIRQYFDAGFSKIEDLASGVVYCQIIDNIHPGSIPMSKVKMTAKTEVDSLHNFKILQTAFGKKKIDRFIEVDKLVKRSFQFNMEFVQFMKCYWDMHAPDGVAPASDGAALQEQQVPNEQPKPPAPKQPASKPSTAREGGGAGLGAGPKRVGGIGGGPRRTSAAGAAAGAAPPSARVDQLEKEVSELKLSVDNLERERDFYYMKLREVEILCQAKEGEQIPALKEVIDILYKTDDADEFAAPDDTELEPALVAAA